MSFIPLCLNIDESIVKQEKLKSQLKEIIDLCSLEKDIRLWASKNGLRLLRETIKSLRQKYSDSWITFLGSGDFHHVTLLLLETLQREYHPITLVLIDNHPDWFCQLPTFHCGNWVSGALKLNYVSSVILVGQDSKDLKGLSFIFSPFEEICKGRVSIHPYRKEKSLIPFRWIKQIKGVEKSYKRFCGTEIQFKTIQSQGAELFFSELSKTLANKNIYISIDKDCLRKEDALTDWEQGVLSLSELKIGIKKLMKSCNVIGVDICGEKAPHQISGLLKKIDSNRIFNSKLESTHDVNEINERTNLELFELLFS